MPWIDTLFDKAIDFAVGAAAAATGVAVVQNWDDITDSVSRMFGGGKAIDERNAKTKAEADALRVTRVTEMATAVAKQIDATAAVREAALLTKVESTVTSSIQPVVERLEKIQVPTAAQYAEAMTPALEKLGASIVQAIQTNGQRATAPAEATPDRAGRPTKKVEQRHAA